MDRGLRRLLAGLLCSGCLLSQPSGLAVGLAAPAPATLPGPRPESANLRITELVKQARDLHYEASRHRSRESTERIKLMKSAIDTLRRAVQLSLIHI